MSANLEQRVARLEADRRRWRAACLVVLVASGALFLARGSYAKEDGTTPKAAALRVTRLELVDAEGVVRARLALDDDDRAKLALFGASEKGRRAELSAGPSSSPALVLRNDRGMGQIIASVSESGPAVLLCDAAGDTGTSLTLKNKNGTSLLGMRLPGEKKLRAVMTVMDDGSPYVKLRGPEGQLRIFAKPAMEYTPAEAK